jgi:uncharacterized protein HemX
MENETQKQQQDIVKPTKRKGSFKKKAYLLLVLILIGAGVYCYVWIMNANKLRVEAASVIQRANQYDTLSLFIESERSRCESFIVREEGNFGNFEYCKNFIEWVSNAPILNQ